ncbi:MAG: DUF2752 domain-containing protein [Saprospiraceae bacterium]|nr:DUF2752 domain-containing protein [Saprospiraceae bacterium]
MKVRKELERAVHVLITALPFFLLLLPADYFDRGQSICLSKALLNMECYGCGMTRAVMHMIHFDFAGAWAFNKISFIVVPLLVPLWLKSALTLAGKKLPPFLDRYY